MGINNREDEGGGATKQDGRGGGVQFHPDKKGCGKSFSHPEGGLAWGVP